MMLTDNHSIKEVSPHPTFLASWSGLTMLAKVLCFPANKVRSRKVLTRAQLLIEVEHLACRTA